MRIKIQKMKFIQIIREGNILWGMYHFLRLGCDWWTAFIVLFVHVGIEPGIFVPDIQYMVDLSQRIAYI